MMIATTKGRLHTKILTFMISGPLAVIFAYIDVCYAYITMFMVMMVVGLLLEAVWSYIVDYESGWMTIAFALIEFSYVFVLVRGFNIDHLMSGDEATFSEGVLYYFTAWILIQLFLIYIVPIWRLSWADNGSEIWS